MRIFRNLGLAAAVVATIGGASVHAKPTDSPYKMINGKECVTMEVPGSSFRVADASTGDMLKQLTNARTLVHVVKASGLSDKELAAVDNGDKVILEKEFIRALEAKYGAIRGYELTNGEFKVVR
jgi:hypothetical protein